MMKLPAILSVLGLSLATLSAQNAPVASQCACHLASMAAAGLLEGYACTIHWQCIAGLREMPVLVREFAEGEIASAGYERLIVIAEGWAGAISELAEREATLIVEVTERPEPGRPGAGRTFMA